MENPLGRFESKRGFVFICYVAIFSNCYVTRNDPHAPKPSTKTPPKKKRTRKVAKGVVFCEGCKSKPYRFVKTIEKKRKQLYFATLEEAVEALKAYKQTKVDAFSAKRQRSAKKRAANLATCGGNSALERRVSDAFVKKWQDLTGRDAMVLNDGTSGDNLLQREKDKDCYLVVQVKSTKQKVKGKNGIHFSHVREYPDMPVLCFCESDAIGWIIDGTKLYERGTEDLTITPNAPLEEELALATECPVERLYADAFIPENA